MAFTQRRVQHMYRNADVIEIVIIEHECRL